MNRVCLLAPTPSARNADIQIRHHSEMIARPHAIDGLVEHDRRGIDMGKSPSRLLSSRTRGSNFSSASVFIRRAQLFEPFSSVFAVRIRRRKNYGYCTCCF
jgi:hypothetical protein